MATDQDHCESTRRADDSFHRWTAIASRLRFGDRAQFAPDAPLDADEQAGARPGRAFRRHRNRGFADIETIAFRECDRRGECASAEPAAHRGMISMRMTEWKLLSVPSLRGPSDVSLAPGPSTDAIATPNPA